MGLTALPKATHLTSYSYRARRAASEKLLAGVTGRMRELGLATGEQGFNLDFHAIRHHGQDVPLEKHYAPARSQRTRAVLTFFAQDHASQDFALLKPQPVFLTEDRGKRGQGASPPPLTRL